MQIVKAEPLPTPGIGTGRFVEVNGVSTYQPPGTSVSFKPRSTTRTSTAYKKVALPKKEYVTYRGAGIPDEETATIPTKSVFGTTPQERKEYVRAVQDYNQQVRTEKKKVDEYNKEVKKWNEKGRFQKVKTTQTITGRTYDITVEGLKKPTELKQTQTKTNAFGFDALNLFKFQVPTSTIKQTPTDYTWLDFAQSKMYPTEQQKREQFVKEQEQKQKETWENFKAGLSFVGKTTKEKGLKGLGTAVSKEFTTSFYPKSKEFVLQGYEYIKSSPFSPLGWIAKGTEAVSRTGTRLVTAFPETSTLAYKGALVSGDAMTRSIKTTPGLLIGGYKKVTGYKLPDTRSLLASGYTSIYKPLSTEFKERTDPEKLKAERKQIKDLFKNVKPLYETEPVPGLEKTGLKRIKPISEFEQRYQKAKATELLSKPETYAFGAEVLGDIALFNLPALGQSLRGSWVRFGSKYVDPKTVLSRQAIDKFGKPTTALVRTKSVPSAFKSVAKTKGAYPEYPKHYVMITSEQSDLGKIYRSITTAEKKALKLKIRYEDPTQYFATKGEANVWALRLSPAYDYKLSLLPSTKGISKPVFRELLVKRAERLPRKVLFTKGFDTIEDYQKYLARVKPSTVLFPKRSEVSRIGYNEIIKKIKAVDPKIHGSSELQLTKGVDILERPAKKLLSTPISKLKGYSEYTVIFGQPIPIRKGIVSGASIYTKGSRKKLYQQFYGLTPLKVSDKGFINLSSIDKKISKEFNDLLYEQGVKAYQRDMARKTATAVSSAQSSSQIKIPVTSLVGMFSKLYKTPESKYSLTYPDISLTYSVPKPDYEITYPDTSTTYDLTSTDTRYDTQTDEIRYPVSEPTYSVTAPERPYLTPTPTISGGRYVTASKRPKKKEKDYVSGEPAYDVLVKVGRVWKNKTNGKRNFYSAVHRGVNIVDNTTAKSFKIKKGTGRANIFKQNMPYNINKFYTPSKTRSARLTGAYIEKSRYAIDTPGEKKGLSVAKYLRGVKLI